ncbi:MAG TPA: multiheme c-type cytochrome, partial [Armatimonadota bacterium]|nr:multiheme c-type cytochrome [Armatimonadota bacterium]
MPSPARAPRSLPQMAAWGGLALSAVAAVYIVTRGRGASNPAAVVAFFAHLLLFPVGIAALLRATGQTARSAAGIAALLTVVLGLLAWVKGLHPAARSLVVYGHILTAVAALGMVGWAARARATGANRRALIGALFAALLLIPLAGYCVSESSRFSWRPPPYDATACYRFLTATTEEQSGEALFPSALRIGRAPARSCTDSGCHADVHREWSEHGHATSGSSAAYRATFRDFTRRRGAVAARWCRGCHDPGSLAAPPLAPGAPPTVVSRTTGATAGAGGVTCVTCHAATDAHALFGSAALVVAARPTAPRDVMLRPKEHASQNMRPGLLRSSEFCAGCHRKNWSIPQNAYRWMPGPDEYREWQSSAYSGSSLFAPGEPRAVQGCGGCHAPHGPRATTTRRLRPSMELDLFFQRRDA